MSDSLVSVIIPTYGGGEFLSRAVDSVLNQTYKNVEIIVVDDNGINTENQLKTVQVMSKYDAFSNVKYICHEINRNGSAARNTGVRHSSGTYIGFLDDDDIYLPEKIEKQIAVLSELDESYGLVYCSNEVYRGNKKISEAHVYKEGYVFADILKSSIEISTPSILVRKSAYDSIGGFDESFRRHQDLEFLVRMTCSFKAKPVKFIGFRIYITNRNSAKNIEQAMIWREHYLAKMQPFICNLSEKEQNDINVYQRLDVAFMFLKQKNFKAYFKECKRINAGSRAFMSIWKKVLHHIKNKLKIHH